MRPTLVLLVAAACGAPPPPPPAPPASDLTEADVAGTWNGVIFPEGSDSIALRWTQRCSAGACIGMTEGETDSILSTYRFSGDSVVGATTAHPSPAFGGAMVVNVWTLRLVDGRAVGHGMFQAAENPDSVLMRYRLDGSRAP